MFMTRRGMLRAALPAVPLLLAGRFARPATAASPQTTLKISHQFPGGSIDEGDFRDRLCRKFARLVTEKTSGALDFQVYPGSSLMKTIAQFAALRRGALDISLFPISYAGGEIKELNIALMPAIISSYAQAARWKNSAAGRMLRQILEERGIVMLSWIWHAGGIASRGKAVTDPASAAGMKIRGGSREVDLLLKAAGSSVVTMPSNELYVAMQTGAVDAAISSSTSLMSFRLEELSKALTTARKHTFWFVLEPLVMSKAVFDALPREQRDAIVAAGEEVEVFGQQAARADDMAAADVYAAAGAEVFDIDEAAFLQWRALAERSAWKDFAERSERCAELLKLAEAV